jgi:hypothetical protein
MAHQRVEALSRQFEGLAPFPAGGRQFRMFLTGVREPVLPTELHYIVSFGARDGAESYTGELGLGRETFERNDIAALAIDTMKAIIEGRLPSGARSLL